jgi:hypothetical protein
MAKQPAKVITCPQCRLISPLDAMRCDCGYDFVTRSMRVKPPVLEPPDRVHEVASTSAVNALKMNYAFRAFVLPFVSAGLCWIVSGSLSGVGGILILATIIEHWHYRRDLMTEHQKGHQRNPRCPLCRQS